jgi:hypothetical protein
MKNMFFSSGSDSPGEYARSSLSLRNVGRETGLNLMETKEFHASAGSWFMLLKSVATFYDDRLYFSC